MEEVNSLELVGFDEDWDAKRKRLA
ncbi:hypothetical protein C5167_023298 [Papaver somniferum]|uniref:Uncharacterized protein n=1 Tax=Papaver somniferum TaxID=3469 RepID=A0A4Y7JPD3_PAPSO|nr:hypothetical protein C5167_023298 [Papaver somniferum]